MVITYAAAGETVVRLGEWRNLTDASAALPSGSYTTLRTYGAGRLVRLAQHVERLRTSVSPAVPSSDLTEQRVRQAVAAALRDTGNPESRIRLTFAPPRLFVSVEAFSPLPDALYRDGVACVTVPVRRENPQAKSTGFLATAQAAADVLPQGVHEGLMVAEDGAILEGLSSNFFGITGKTLRTEDARALSGVTRSMVLEIATSLLAARGPAVHLAELETVAECFVTSVSREILPVVKVDERTIGDGRPGPFTRELMHRFRETVEREAEAVS
jgi:branched-chain amino acid aminotransferase